MPQPKKRLLERLLPVLMIAETTAIVGCCYILYKNRIEMQHHLAEASDEILRLVAANKDFLYIPNLGVYEVAG